MHGAVQKDNQQYFETWKFRKHQKTKSIFISNEITDIMLPNPKYILI